MRSECSSVKNEKRLEFAGLGVVGVLEMVRLPARGFIEV